MVVWFRNWLGICSFRKALLCIYYSAFLARSCLCASHWEYCTLSIDIVHGVLCMVYCAWRIKHGASALARVLALTLALTLTLTAKRKRRIIEQLNVREDDTRQPDWAAQLVEGQIHRRNRRHLVQCQRKGSCKHTTTIESSSSQVGR